MADAQWMASLLARVPVHVIDVAAAQKAGDAVALAYHAAMAAWRDEAALALAEVEMIGVEAMGGESDVEGRLPLGPALARNAELVMAGAVG